MASSSKRAPDKMNEIIGEMGRWQMQNIFIVFLVGIPGLAHVYSSVFVAAKTDYWCLDDVTEAMDPTNPRNVSRGEDVCHQACQQGYGFDQSFWQSTMIIEFQLVCQHKYLAIIGKMIFFGGFAFGTFFAGLVSDKYGRKQAIVLMAQLLFGCGLLASIMPSYLPFIVVWWATGAAAIGVYTVCFVWAIESVSGRWKTFVAMGMNYAWPVGRLTLPIVAYIARDWKIILQVLSVVHIATPFIMNLVPESPRWLLATNKKAKLEEAREVLKAAAVVNGTYDNESTDAKIQELVRLKTEDEIAKEKGKQLGFLDLFKHKVLLKRALVMYVNWFANSFILYGLALNWQSLTGSLFTNFCIGAALDFPAKTLAGLLMVKVGRRWPYIVCITLAGTSFLMMSVFERGYYTNDWPIVTMAMLGNLFISTTFAIIWPYTPELFPTNIRNASLGSCSLVARVGGILANLVGTLAEVNIHIPTILFGSSALLSAVLSLMLPETGGKPLPETIEDCIRNESKSRGQRSPAKTDPQEAVAPPSYAKIEME